MVILNMFCDRSKLSRRKIIRICWRRNIWWKGGFWGWRVWASNVRGSRCRHGGKLLFNYKLDIWTIPGRLYSNCWMLVSDGVSIRTLRLLVWDSSKWMDEVVRSRLQARNSGVVLGLFRYLLFMPRDWSWKILVIQVRYGWINECVCILLRY